MFLFHDIISSLWIVIYRDKYDWKYTKIEMIFPY